MNQKEVTFKISTLLEKLEEEDQDPELMHHASRPDRVL